MTTATTQRAPGMVRLKFHPYGQPGEAWVEIKATVRGDLAIHRTATLDARSEGGLSIGKEWTVSHILTGERVASALPQRLGGRGKVCGTRAELLAWAEAVQLACPEFFDEARKPGFFEARNGPDRERIVALARAVLDKGRAL